MIKMTCFKLVHKLDLTHLHRDILTLLTRDTLYLSPFSHISHISQFSLFTKSSENHLWQTRNTSNSENNIVLHIIYLGRFSAIYRRVVSNSCHLVCKCDAQSEIE